MIVILSLGRQYNKRIEPFAGEYTTIRVYSLFRLFLKKNILKKVNCQEGICLLRYIEVMKYGI